MSELLSVEDVQKRLKLSERTIFNLIKRGDLKGFKAGRAWRFEIEDIQAYERQQREKAEKEIRKKDEHPHMASPQQ